MASPVVTEALIAKVTAVLRSGKWAQGTVVTELEDLFCQLTGATYAVAVNSGTAALHALLQSYQFDKNDEVISSPFTFIASVNAIVMAGATPVFADIRRDDFTLDPVAVEKKITKHTKAILAIDLYGQPARYTDLKKVADKHGLILLGDCAQSIGATHHGKSPVSYASGATYSLYATKNIAAGEGGVIVTNDPHTAEFMRSFRHHGQEFNSGHQYSYTMLGFNYRMTDIQAAIAVEQLRLIDAISLRRQHIAKTYESGFKDIDGLQLPVIHPENQHVFHQYTIRVLKKGSRDRLKQALADAGVQTGIFYPMSLHLASHLRSLGYGKGDFPEAEKAQDEVLSLPIHYNLTDADQKQVIQAVRTFFTS